MTPPDPEVERVARERFGWERLRPAQLEAIGAAVAGRDVLAVLATGYGKSAVYQVAAAMRPGLTVVVSPLIALQEDQLAGLASAPDAPAGVALNSLRGARAQREAWKRLRAGEAEYVLLAPEQLAKDEVLAQLAELETSLLVVDEAHCIAAWGHDFRPDYLLIGALADRLGRPPIVALTATASTPVREEIVARLGLDDAVVLVGDVDRPELSLAVHRHTDEAAKRAAVIDDVRAEPHPGLLYVATRREAESYAGELADAGLRSAAYHAGLAAAERRRTHERFLDGGLDVVVATSAFGMGIDKEDVRFVVHADAPDSVDAYYQEVGRAGRDGEAASAVLHYRPEDLALRRYFASKRPRAEDLLRVLEAVVAGARTRPEIAEAAGIPARRAASLLVLLADVAAVRITRRGVLPRARVVVAEAVDAALERAEERERIDRSRIDMLRGYAETRRCRRQVLLGYFGQEPPQPCGNCDTCAAGAAGDPDAAAPSGSFAVDDRVEHPEWGAGIVTAVEDDRLTVFFESAGYKVLALEAVERGDLLDRLSA